MLREVLQELQLAIQEQRPAAYTALVETRGSTPQKPGAAMLVFPDGSQVGTLGGGCVEAEVKRQALRLLDQGSAQILTFHLDNDYGWDDGLICGGRMRMLVDPVRAGDDLSYFTHLHELVMKGQPGTEAVVLDEEKCDGGAAADRFLFDADGRLIAGRAQAPMPESLPQQLKPISQRPRPYVAGGVSFLPILERCRLIIVGAGHVGQKVAELAAQVDFDVWVVDDRAEYCNPERFPQAKRLIVAPIDTALSGLEVDPHTMCVIVTRGHRHDEEALYHLAEKPARYVGMIGSRRKIRLILDDLLREGISREALARVCAPVGFDIGSQSVPEIAVSIVAELIAVRNLGHEVAARYRGPSLLDELPDPRKPADMPHD